MFNIVHKYKGSHVFFATDNPSGSHQVNFSAYGSPASELLEKYLGNQREDHEDLFSKWDISYKEAVTKPGFSATIDVENSFIYISTFQNGIGITPEDKIKSKKVSPKTGSTGVGVPVYQSDDDGFERAEDDSEGDYDE
ncbi:hypothetical protein FJZ33_09965 [Candidatus Poribacteria bacterium]|nr:hypothetical protein [Candidatus Poribacteria bacterium]